MCVYSEIVQTRSKHTTLKIISFINIQTGLEEKYKRVLTTISHDLYNRELIILSFGRTSNGR